jgi:predicted nucleic acid-binding protein
MSKWASIHNLNIHLFLYAEDPDDDKFFAYATAGRADIIVGEDKHLMKNRDMGTLGCSDQNAKVSLLRSSGFFSQTVKAHTRLPSRRLSDLHPFRENNRQPPETA